jgi:hypothetical protein
MQSTVCVYAGQQVLTGKQAEVFANDYIAAHLAAIGGGKTYSQLSAEAMAQPDNTALQNQVATLFKGTTLRGLLLEAYAFSTMGMIAFIAGVAAFATAFLFMILTFLGYRHFRRTDDSVELLAHNADDKATDKELVNA